VRRCARHRRQGRVDADRDRADRAEHVQRRPVGAAVQDHRNADRGDERRSTSAAAEPDTARTVP
jgi:hypothetical protein